MARHKDKERNTIKVGFSIDEESFERFKDLAKFERMKQNEFLELLVHRWDEELNPEQRISTLFGKRTQLNNDLLKIEKEIKETSQHLEIQNKLRRQKIARKPEAIKQIRTQLLREDFESAQRISRFHQKATGLSSMELIVEAQKSLEEEGI